MSEIPPDSRRQWILDVLDEYETPLLRFAGRMLGDEASARDVVQFTLLRLCDQPPEGLRGREGPWLFTVCRNKAVDMLRKRKQTESLETTQATTAESQATGPDEVAEQKDLYEHLRRLIDRLPAAQREAVSLWAEGFNYARIAEIIDHSEGNVRVLVHRALKQLRTHPSVQRLVEEGLEARG